MGATYLESVLESPDNWNALVGDLASLYEFEKPKHCRGVLQIFNHLLSKEEKLYSDHMDSFNKMMVSSLEFNDVGTQLESVRLFDTVASINKNNKDIIQGMFKGVLVLLEKLVVS